MRSRDRNDGGVYMAVTTKDIAVACHVSRSTVTRALNNKDRISPETKELVISKAKELGYEPDLYARGMVKGTTMTIGVVLCDLRNMYFPSVIDAMGPVAREYGYILNIMLHNNNKEMEQSVIKRLMGHRIDGLILDPACSNKEDYKFLEKYSVPTVIIGGKEIDGFSFVGNDEYNSAGKAVNYIVSKGYDTVCFVFPESENNNDAFGGHHERRRGVRDKAAELGVLFQNIQTADYATTALNIVRNSDRKTAFLCSGDIYAGQIMALLGQNGFIAGEDYGIMGYDHLDLMNIFPRKLVTIENHKEMVGTEAVRLILELTKKKTKKTYKELVPCEIINGNTV